MPDTEWFDAPGGEPVELHEPDPAWSSLAEAWMTNIVTAVAPLPVEMEHIGSTSIPGLIAKPVIDLQLAVPDIIAEASYDTGLRSLGLVLRQREAEHRFYRPPAGEPRVVHVHVCQRGSSWERDHLAFRDRLRADPTLAGAYASLKRRLAAEVGHDRLEYTAQKSRFISDVLRLR